MVNKYSVYGVTVMLTTAFFIITVRPYLAFRKRRNWEKEVEQYLKDPSKPSDKGD